MVAHRTETSSSCKEEGARRQNSEAEYQGSNGKSLTNAYKNHENGAVYDIGSEMALYLGEMLLEYT